MDEMSTTTLHREPSTPLCSHCAAPANVEVVRPLPALWCWVLPASKLIPIFKRAGWKLATGPVTLTEGVCQCCAAELHQAEALAAAQAQAEKAAAEARRRHQERTEARRRSRAEEAVRERSRRAQEPITGGLFGGAP